MLIYFLSFLLNYTLCKSEQLIFVQTFCRHGSRSPLKFFNGRDALGIKWNGTGELTPTGKRMHYLLGVFNRQRYITGTYKFLSKKYDPHELVVFSSDVDRTLLSITSQLQGLYPMSKETGEELNQEQLKESFPPFNITCEEVEKELKVLNNSALPNYMTIIPIHYITIENETKECTEKKNTFKNDNYINKKIIKNLEEEFIKNYSSIISPPKGVELNFESISFLYDQYISDITEGKNLSNYLKDIDKNIFSENSYKFLTIFFRDYVFGDDKNEVILFYTSLLMRQMIDNIKRKVDDDIAGKSSLSDISDYSRPKMVMISGHDFTLSALEMFFIKYFGLKFEEFEYPKYCSQISYEITRDENISDKKKEYSDYKASYYFNDKLLLNITLDKFIEKIDEVIWNDRQMDRFCFGDKKEGEIFNKNSIVLLSVGFLMLILTVIIVFLRLH